MGMPGIVIQVAAETKDAIDGINRVNKALGDDSGMTKFKNGVQSAFVPAAAALGALGVAAWDFSKAAMEDQKSAALLAQSLTKTTGASKAQIAATEEWISAQGKALGVADDKLRPALQTLALATGDVAKAQELAAIAMDISAARGVDVEAASKAMAKAATGNTAALNKLIPGLDEAVLKSGDLAAIQAEVAKKVGGSAATAANTAAGKMERMALAIGEAKEGIGAALLPLIEKFLPYLQGMAEWAQENADVLFKLGVVVGGVAGAIVAANVAIKIYEGLQIAMKAATVAWTAAQWLLNAALNANPIGLVVIAITALIAIFVLAYNKVDWFRKLVDTAWAAIQTAIESVVNWFRDTAWPVLKTIFEWIGAAVGLYLTPWKLAFEAIKTVIGVLASSFETAFETIKNVLQSAWDFMRPIFDKIKSAIDAVKAGADFIGGIGGAIGGAFSRSAPVPSSLGAIDPSSRAYVSTGRGAMTSAGTNIVINGAIDPVSTAKQIKRILGTGNMRLGVS